MQCISYTNGYPLVLIPLTSLILLNGLKDFIEDRKRKLSDIEENENEVLIYNQTTKRFITDFWKNIKLGDIIKVKKENQFPCDLIFLQSSPEAKGQCKIDTKNINGETNLNIKKINPNFNLQNVFDLNHLCVTKKPNEYIYEFEAILYPITNYHNSLNINKEQAFHFNYDNFILRGSSLRQTEYIIGVAVYIGHNTKSMQNNPLSKQKISKLEVSMNFQILYIFIFQIILSIICSIINIIIFYSNNKFIDIYVKTAENNDSFFLRFIKMIGTWTLFLTNFVPIPLLSTLEFIKFFQAMFISHDADMTDKYTLDRVKVQASTLNDELGQINYIFTDKTGTLTKNNMQFKAFTVGEKSFGNIENLNDKSFYEGKELRDRYGRITNVGFIDYNDELKNEILNKDKNGNYLLEHFFLNILLNNSAVIDNNKFNTQKEIEYLCSSSDEKCLLNFARFCGYTFMDRSVDNVISIEKVVEQTKMCKINYSISNKIKEYSEKGLRILVFGYKAISKEEYNNFDNKYKEILYDINHKESDLHDLYDELEDGIELLGVSAIEDELQNDVEETINKFVSIGIKVCMLTGDKYETAKSIASNCNLITKNMNCINLINPPKSMQDLENTLNQIYEDLSTNINNQKNCLIITGEVFFKITANKSTIFLFSKLFDLSETILFCRISPKQKAQIVQIIKEYNPQKTTLSIGDGANDVGMILESDVGIGIQGKEGVEAARASDYSLPEFSYLQKLFNNNR